MVIKDMTAITLKDLWKEDPIHKVPGKAESHLLK